MKKRLTFIYTLLSIVLVAQLAISLLPVSRMVAVVLTIAAIVIVAISVFFWLRHSRDVIRRFAKVVNAKDESRISLSLEVLDILDERVDQLENKITDSADRIRKLTNLDKVDVSQTVQPGDRIGEALHDITGEMLKMKEETERRNWITQGLGRFSDILGRKLEIKEYSYTIISALVKYLDANQGGFYLGGKDENGESFLELAGCYAYSKRKYLEARIPPGEGLLGQCMLERDFLYIKDVPKSYIKITSGLGEATPRNIVVAPLIFNDQFLGAMEIASFKVLEAHHMEFLKKVSENIASQIATLRNMEQTQGLLNESNVLARELQTREEEMRQNLEELVATQEAMEKKQSELTGIINAIDSTLGTAEFSIEGRLQRYNGILTRIFGAGETDLYERDYTLITGPEHFSWPKVVRGNIKEGEFRTMALNGAERWLSVTFTTVNDLAGNAVKVLCMVQDITMKKIREQEFEKLSLVANNTDNSVIITNKAGLIEYVNSGFTKVTGYSFEEVEGRKPGKILQGPLTDKNTIKKLSQQIRLGVPVYEEILNYHKNGEFYWISLMINPVRNSAGDIEKFISIQADITQTKLRALDFHQKMEALSRSNAIMEVDTQGLIIEVNENYLKMLGYERKDLVGNPYCALAGLSESDFRDLIDGLRSAGMHSGEFMRVDSDGEEICLKLMHYPVLNMNGEVEKIIEFGVDITKEKEFEKQAERKQAELNSYLGGINNTIASAEFDLEGAFLSGNDIFRKVMGFHHEELAGYTFTSFMGEDPAVVMMWENLRLGKFFSGEFRMRNKTGHELWLNGTFNPVIISGKVPEKIIMFAQFTTMEKEKLNDLNGLVHAFKSALPVLEFTPDFACKSGNDKAMKMFGLTRLSVKSKTIVDFLAPFYHTIWQSKAGEVLSRESTTVILPFSVDEHIVNYEVNLSVIRNLEGRPGKILLILVKEVKDHVSFLAAV